MQPLILSLKLKNAAFEFFDCLRKQHFPPERNFLPAHVTLFHALPGASETEIRQTLGKIANETALLRLRFPSVRFLGKGVAIEIESPDLIKLRGRLAEIWRENLGNQDLQKYRPHVTVQNKVAPETARELFERLSAEWKSFDSTGEGLLLWRYLNGPWELIEEFDFKSFPQN